MYFDRDTVGTKVNYVGTKGALAKEITLKGLQVENNGRQMKKYLKLNCH